MPAKIYSDYTAKAPYVNADSQYESLLLTDQVNYNNLAWIWDKVHGIIVDNKSATGKNEYNCENKNYR